MRGRIAAALLVGLAAAAATAQEPIVYKTYAYKTGNVTRTTKTEEATTVTLMGKDQKKDERKAKTVVYKTEVLAVGADPTKPEKVRRTYETAVETVNGAEAKLPLDGLAVVIERAGGAYTFRAADGAKLPAKAAAELDKEFNKKGKLDDRDLFPKGGVKVGDTWGLTKTFLTEMDTPDNPFVFDAAKAKVTGKLPTVTTKGGATAGDILVTADLPIKAMNGPVPIQIEPESRWTIAMKGSGVLDGTSPEGATAGTMRIGIVGSVQGTALKVDADVKQTQKTERVTGAK